MLSFKRMNLSHANITTMIIFLSKVLNIVNIIL